MKKIMLCAMMILLSFGLQAQDHKIEITKFFEHYASLCKNGEWAKTLDHVHPSLFEIVPKEKMTEILINSLTTNLFGIELEGLKLNSISDPFTFEDRTYALISYEGQMVLTFDEEIDDDELEAIVDAMTAQYGEENATLEEKYKLRIKMNSKSGIMMRDSGADWKILEYSEERIKMVNMLIPKKVRKHFGLK